MSFTISRTRWIQAASTHGTTPAAGRPTASAPYQSGRPATAAMATLPGNPDGLRSGEYSAITANAARPTRSAVPLTSAAATTPTKTPTPTTRWAASRRTRPAATGRSPAGRFAQHRDRPCGHLVHRPDGSEVARFAVGDDLRQPAGAARDDRDAARHRLERGEAEGLALRRQQEQVRAAQDVSDVVNLPEEPHVFGEAEAVDLGLSGVAVRAVADQHQRRGEHL